MLTDHKKLPFMAMLRNLRNMIKAGISEKHHNWVIKKLTDEGSVIYSRQFPFRFFSAYEVLSNLEKEFNENREYHKIFNIRHTKFQNLNDSHLVLQLSLPNPLKPGVKLRMKM